jgi:hypothetical protein
MPSSIEANSNSEKTVVLIEGEPLGGLRKLLQGFCNPGHVDDEEDETAEISLSEQTERNILLETDKVARGVKEMGKKEQGNGEGERDEASQTGKEMKEESKVEETVERPKSKAVQDGSKLRTKRSTEVVVFAFLAVMFTIYSLRYLGFTMDFSVKESPRTAVPKKIIDIEKKADFDSKARESLKELQDLVAEIKKKGH